MKFFTPDLIISSSVICGGITPSDKEMNQLTTAGRWVGPPVLVFTWHIGENQVGVVKALTSLGLLSAARALGFKVPIVECFNFDAEHYWGDDFGANLSPQKLLEMFDKSASDNGDKGGIDLDSWTRSRIILSHGI